MAMDGLVSVDNASKIKVSHPHAIFLSEAYKSAYARELAQFKRRLLPPRNLRSMTAEQFLAFVRKSVLKHAGRRIELTGGQRRSYSMLICWRHRIPRVDMRVEPSDVQKSMYRVRSLAAVVRLRRLEMSHLKLHRSPDGTRCVCDGEMERGPALGSERTRGFWR